MLEDGVVEGRIFLMPIGPRGDRRCGRAATMGAIESARRTATSRHARLGWPRSPRAGDDNSQTTGAYLSGKLSGLMFQTMLSVGRSGRI